MISEQDYRYVAYWEPPAMAILVIILVVTIVLVQRSEIRDLQRRIAVLESERR